MGRVAGWIARVVFRRRRSSESPEDPAGELRRKLAEARARETELGAEPEPELDQPEAPDAAATAQATGAAQADESDLERLRRDVRERARKLADEFRSGSRDARDD